MHGSHTDALKPGTQSLPPIDLRQDQTQAQNCNPASWLHKPRLHLSDCRGSAPTGYHGNPPTNTRDSVLALLPVALSSRTAHRRALASHPTSRKARA